MRLLSLLAILLITGCGTVTPMAELERQALLTGDWSEVEKRERILVRRNMNRSMACPNGYIGYCTENYGQPSCSCVERDVIRAAFSR